MMACSVWLARDFLIKSGRDPGPPCSHDHDQCPEIGEIQMPELSEKESRDLRVLVDEIPGEDGWWHRSNAETFTDLAQQLMERGFTASAAVELLGSAYAAAASEFGN